MFDMKMTTLMRLVLLLLVYFMLTSLFIATGSEELTSTSMDIIEIEPVVEEIENEEKETDIDIRNPLELQAPTSFLPEKGFFGIVKEGFIDMAKYTTKIFKTFIKLITFDIPFPKFMANTFLVYAIRTTVGTTVTIIMIIILIQLVTMIKNMVSPFSG